MSDPKSQKNAHPDRGILIRFDLGVRSLIVFLARVIGFLILAIIAVILLDVLTRGSPWVNSTALQELEWHVHATIVMLCLGYAYLTDSHVRIGLFRDKWRPKTQALVEAVGFLIFLVPYCVVSIHYGVDYTATSFGQGERSPSPGGLDYRWLVKATLPIGMTLLMLAGVSVFIRSVLVLVRPAEAAPEIFMKDGTAEGGHG